MGYLMITNYILGFLIPHTQYEFNIFEKLNRLESKSSLIITGFESY